VRPARTAPHCARRLVLVVGVGLLLRNAFAIDHDGQAPGAPVSPEAAAAGLEASADPCLATRVTVEWRGAPLDDLLKRISGASGVTFRVSDPFGAHRVIAVMRDRPLVEILGAIAALYRLRWVPAHECGSVVYQLSKARGAAIEEARLREALVERLLAAPVGGDAPGPARGGETVGAAARRCFLQVAPALSGDQARVLAARRYYRLPLTGSRGHQALGALQPVLEAARADAREAQGLVPELRTQMVDLGVQPSVRNVLLGLELRTTRASRVMMGLRTPWGSIVQARIRASDPAVEYAAAISAYPTDCRPATLGGSQAVAPPPLRSPAQRAVELGAWVALVRELAGRHRVSVLSDWYPGASLSTPPHAFQRPAALEEHLDRICSAAVSTVPRIWWRRGGVVFIRSSEWLWGDEAVIPLRLHRRLEALGSTGKPFSAGDLPALAALPSPAIQALMGEDCGPFALDVWEGAVRLPAAFRPATRRALLNGGIAWRILLGDERRRCYQYAGEDAEGAQGYRARLRSFRFAGGLGLNVDLSLGAHDSPVTVLFPLDTVDAGSVTVTPN